MAKAKAHVITDAARARGAQSKMQRGIFNQYLRALQRPHAKTSDKSEEIADIDAVLARGTRPKKCPVFEGRKRVGTTVRECPLLPSERADLLARRAAAEQMIAPRASDRLRTAFLDILFEFAQRNGFTRSMLIEAGVPPQDCDEVGIPA